MPPQFSLFQDLYRIEWVQHQFPYYNIQSLDVVQMPRMPADLGAFENALAIRNTPDGVQMLARRWQLTNTRFLLGPAGFRDVLNDQLDPKQQRFRIVQHFDVLPRPGIERPTKLEELTAVPNDNGNYALFEFTGALPRVKLYSNWQVSTNDAAVLKTLADANFDPAKTVLVSPPAPGLPVINTNENSGSVEFKRYTPKDIVFAANAATPSVLLLNDKYDPNWQVLVDAKPAALLRCNFIMRGVYLSPGEHTVEFTFALPHGPLYASLAAIGVTVFLCGSLIVLTRRRPATAA